MRQRETTFGIGKVSLFRWSYTRHHFIHQLQFCREIVQVVHSSCWEHLSIGRIPGLDIKHCPVVRDKWYWPPDKYFCSVTVPADQWNYQTHSTPSEAGQVKLSLGKWKPHGTCPRGKCLKKLMSRPGYLKQVSKKCNPKQMQHVYRVSNP